MSKSVKNNVNNEDDSYIRNPAENEGADIENSPVSEATTEQINETGAGLVNRNGVIIHCLTIEGQIEGHYLLPQSNKATKYSQYLWRRC